MGLPLAKSSVFLAILLCFFLCLGLSLLRDPLYRKIYSTSCGLLLGFYCYGFGYLVVIIHFSTTWLIAAMLPRNAAFYAANAFAFGTTGYMLYLDWLTGLQMVANVFIIVI